jgi:hypothetical protein
LNLFREVHGRRGEHRNRVASTLACPHCRSTLTRTHDVAHNNRFQYSRCAQGHGHFITFFQFLREKGIVRGLNLKELTELRKHVDTLLCSDCGASIPLASQSGCAHCHAPVSILDPDSVQSTVHAAEQAAGSRQDVAPEVAARLLMNNLKLNGFHRKPVAQVAAAAALALPLTHSNQTDSSLGDKAESIADGVELALEVAELDLLDKGIDIVVGGLEALGELFS